MKKIALLISCCCFTIGVYSQNYYNFEKSKSTYEDLSGAISINNGQPWLLDEFGPFSTPFPISTFGITFSDFGFNGDSFVFFNNDDLTTYSSYNPYTTLFLDRYFSQVGTSLSPISYKVDGTIGNRTLKLEIKNAGLISDFAAPNTATSVYYVNFQIWFYEVDNSFEYRFGPTNITNLSVLNDEAILISSFYTVTETEDSSNGQSGFVNGTISNPIYSEFIEYDEEPTSLDAMIPANTVYRFSINTLSNNDKEKVEFAMYPNPTSDVLNLTFSENLDKNYSIYDLLGREVLNGKFENTSEAQISVENLQIGTYILRIGGTNKKFIKK